MTKEELRHKASLAELGCMVCRKVFGITDGPVELHHLRSGGWGKGNYLTLIPLCITHHRGKEGVHTLGTKAWERTYGTQQEFLDMAKALI